MGLQGAGMGRMVQFAASAVLMILLAGTAFAQRHLRHGPQTQFAGDLRSREPFVPGASVLLTGAFPVPGLGFDFTHHAAVSRHLGVRALVDPVTQHQLALARQLHRERGASPVILPIGFGATQIIILQQPPVVILPPAEPARDEERAEPARAAESIPAPAGPPAPPTELPEIVLVRRDGAMVLAVGVSTHEGRVVYVTRDGVRRTFPLRELDAEATRNMNEERGTTLRLAG